MRNLSPYFYLTISEQLICTMNVVVEQPEPNIVGPSLAGRNVEDLKVSEFKHWLSIVRATPKEKS